MTFKGTNRKWMSDLYDRRADITYM